jgi:lysophospholipase L1-like esterase
MKNWYLALLILLSLAFSGLKVVHGQENFRTTYYEQRRTLFESLPNTRNEIVFLGNSITDGGEWTELLNHKRIKNRGISGDTTEGVLFRLREVTESKPSKVFLLIGINDLARGVSPDSVLSNIIRITETILIQSHKTKVYVQSILPVNPDFGKFTGHCSKTEEVIQINAKLKEWCSQSNPYYIDLFTHFSNETDNHMDPAFTNDGLHLTGPGYLKWAEILKHFL